MLAVRGARRPLRYHGGKAQIADRIVELLPPHDVWVEAFCGSAAVTLAKPPAGFEVINDSNGRLVNFWRVLRDQESQLRHAIAMTPYAREEYAACGEISEIPLEDARRFGVLSWMTLRGTQGQFRNETDWRRQTHWEPGGRVVPSEEWAALPARLPGAADRLKRVQVDCKPAPEILQAYDAPNVLFYLDPPYPIFDGASTHRPIKGRRKDRRTGPKRYAEEMTLDQHEAMLRRLQDLQAAVVVSSYDNPLYRRYLSATMGWKSHQFTVRSSTTNAGRDQSQVERVETLWVRGSRPGRGTAPPRQMALAEVPA